MTADDYAAMWAAFLRQGAIGSSRSLYLEKVRLPKDLPYGFGIGGTWSVLPVGAKWKRQSVEGLCVRNVGEA